MRVRKSKKLTPRMWKLYEWLKENYQRKTYWGKKDIQKAMPELYPFEPKGKYYGIEYDISCIKNSTRLELSIVSSHKGYKIGSKAEIMADIERLKAEALAKLKTAELLQYRLNHHGNIYLFNSTNHDYRAYLDED